MMREEECKYTVKWDADDQVFVARVREFPSLAAHGETQELALRELKGVVSFVLQDLAREEGSVTSESQGEA